MSRHSTEWPDGSSVPRGKHQCGFSTQEAKNKTSSSPGEWERASGDVPHQDWTEHSACGHRHIHTYKHRNTHTLDGAFISLLTNPLTPSPILISYGPHKGFTSQHIDWTYGACRRCLSSLSRHVMFRLRGKNMQNVSVNLRDLSEVWTSTWTNHLFLISGSLKILHTQCPALHKWSCSFRHTSDKRAVVLFHWPCNWKPILWRLGLCGAWHDFFGERRRWRFALLRPQPLVQWSTTHTPFFTQHLAQAGCRSSQQLHTLDTHRTPYATAL